MSNNGIIVSSGSLAAVAGRPANISGLSLANEASDLVMVTLASSSGLLLANPMQPGAGIGGSDGTITLTGNAASVSAELSQLSFVATTSGAGTITVTDVDAPTAMTSTATIAVTSTAAPAAATHVWVGNGTAAWGNAANWSVGGQIGVSVPDTVDPVALGLNTVATTITGAGAAGTLAVAGSYTLTGALDDAGAANITGSLTLRGISDAAGATLDSAGATVTGSGAIVDLISAGWTNAGTLSVGSGAEFALRTNGTLDTGSLVIAAGAEIVVQSAATLAVAGTLQSAGLLISLGSLSAAAINLAAGSEAISQGTISVGTITVNAGALLDGAAVIDGLGTATAAIVNDGTIEGAQAGGPIELDGVISGSGTLLVDPGGGLQLDAAVGTGQTVMLQPGVSPLFIDGNGSAGAALLLTDPDQFAGTITGFTPGDRLFVTPDAGVTIASASLNGNTLDLLNAGGTIVDAVALNASALPSGASFTVTANDSLDLFQTLNLASNVVEITSSTAGNLPALSNSGNFRLPEGSSEPVPLISALDPTGYAAGDDFTLTFTATSGTFTELLAGPLFLTQLEDLFSGTSGSNHTIFNPRPVGDGSIDMTSEAGYPFALSISGTGTDTLTLTGNNLFLMDLQSALVEYQAGSSAGSDVVTATFSDGTHTTQTSTTATITAPSSDTTIAWIATGTASALAAGNWIATGGTHLLPGSGDAVSLGTGSYAITGDFSASRLTVSGQALTQGAIYVGGDGTADPLTVQGGGVFGSAGFLYVAGDALVGGNGSGELDTVGPINNIAGNLTIGGNASGYVQDRGLLSVNGDIDIGVGAFGELDLSANPVGGGIDELLGGLLDDQNAIVGMTAGQTGTAEITSGDWDTVGTLTVGGAGIGGVLIDTVPPPGQTSYSDADVSAVALVIGQSAGSRGSIILGTFLQSNPGGGLPGGFLEVENTIQVGAAGTGSLFVGLAGDIDDSMDNDDGSTTLFGTLAIGGAQGGTGSVIVDGGSIEEDTIDVGVVTAGGSGVGSLQVETVSASLQANVINVGSAGSLMLDEGRLQPTTLNVLTGGTASISSTVEFIAGKINVAGGQVTLTVPDLLATSLTTSAGGMFTFSGTLDSSDTLVNAGTIVAVGSTDIMAAIRAGSGSHGTIIVTAGGQLEFDANPDATQTIDLLGNGTIVDSTPGTFFNTTTTSFGGIISGFSSGDAILLNSATRIAGYANNILSVAENADNEMGTVDFTFSGNYSATNFKVQATPGFSTTEIVYVACFVAGTRILTPQGERRVEELRVGDTVATRSGIRLVTWLGHRHIAGARHARPQDVQPIRVAPGAFGPGMPHRTLFLSPDHAVFVDGVLIPVRHLVNDATIRQEPRPDVTYWHVELDRHDVLLADGLPCESYLDTGNRGAFVEGGSAIDLDADFAMRIWDTRSCCPLILAGPALRAARQRLLDLAVGSGQELVGNPDLRVFAGGIELPSLQDGTRLRVTVPSGAREVLLRSRSAVPAHLHADADDMRELGVAVSQIMLDGHEIALTDGRLSAGWHALEPIGDGLRWTTGNARLAVGQARELVIEVCLTDRYWAENGSVQNQRSTERLMQRRSVAATTR